MSSLIVFRLSLLILASSWAPIHFVIEVVVVVVVTMMMMLLLAFAVHSKPGDGFSSVA